MWLIGRLSVACIFWKINLVRWIRPILNLYTSIKAQSSEQAAVEQEKVQSQLESMSAKLDEVANKKESLIAFRATSVKDSGTSSQQSVKKHGEFW